MRTCYIIRFFAGMAQTLGCVGQHPGLVSGQLVADDMNLGLDYLYVVMLLGRLCWVLGYTKHFCKFLLFC